MKTKDVLHVWYEKQLVGELWQNAAGIIGFRYEKKWLSEGFSISQQLPLRIDPYSPESGKAHHFFANLLPEGDARMHIVRDIKIPNTDFDLLKTIGGECAGAFSILPSDLLPSDTPNYTKLTDDELKKLLMRKGQIFGLMTSNERPRLSLAGAQDKCPIYFDGNQFSIPQGTAPSTHILKFEISGYNNIPAYEYFMTSLARSIGLPVVDMELKTFDGHYYLLIERYDRIPDENNRVYRLHQEDFCQALGVGYDQKYEQHGAPPFQEYFHLVQEVTSNPIKDTENLLRWQIFNLLAGNSDGHAKNLALIYKKNNHAQLAPFYDLVCTRAIERIDTHLAMSIGGEFNPDMITQRHWEQLAYDCDIRSQYLMKLIADMAEALLDNFNKVLQAFENNHGAYPALQRIQKVIHKQCKKTLKQFTQI